MTDLSPHALPLTHALARVAVLIDGDNVPLSCAPDWESRARTLGQVVIRRVYADMGLRKDWAAAVGYDAFHCASGPIKNHADMRLVIGALDLAHRGLARVFVIVSDDRDFAPLVSHLREMGLQAEMVGKPKVAAVSKPQPSGLDAALKTLLKAKAGGVSLMDVGLAMKGQKVIDRTGKATWRAYIKSKPDLFSISGTGQETRVTWCGI